MKKDGIAEREKLQPAIRWTRIDTYLGALARRRSERRRREGPLVGRTEPESPRASLGTAPFLALSLALALIAAAFFLIALPGRDTPRRHAESAAPVAGTAPPGWFEEARREFR